MTIGKLSGQCDFGQKGQSYCNQRGQSCVAKRVKVAWLFHIWRNLRESIAFERLSRSLIKNRGTGVAKYYNPQNELCTIRFADYMGTSSFIYLSCLGMRYF